MFESLNRGRNLVVAGVAAAFLAGCASSSRTPAPVEDRTAGASRGAAVAVEPAASPAKALPGAENAGKPGYYTVKPGDTLVRIALENGQNWRDLVRWNTLENPNVIEVGQVLRVVPPTVAAAAPDTGVVVRPVASGTAAPAAGTPTQTASAPRPVAAASAPAAPAAPAGEDDVSWAWPVNGTLIAGYDEVKNKGLDIGGKAGDAVVAAADGRVVYAGAGLRGYGNLIILKHNNTYLSAYAHNQTLLVKEDQSVRKGQKIAEMGSSDADRVKLHFEIRRQGKPVDPARYLPAR
ncbi:MAG: peptidoglycan DD-metalloendopeptidase family protein [Proteobacteria bacterium]|nr:peptidoglycan DD-metalloendopeptidase family protein [Ramlibacter sp.]MCA0212546.1 peptidoglycan DD-metalloendopeptidase family protein [Pseudomonadota bacterium]